MTPDELKTYSTILLGLWNIVLTVAIWLRKPGEDAGAAVDALEVSHDKRLTEQGTAIMQMQTQLKNMPTSEELAQLEGTVKQINERTQQMLENSRSTSAAVVRIETYLLNNK